MRRHPRIPLVLATLTAAFCLFSQAELRAQSIGEPSPPISAGHWFNWIGDGPTLESLEGRTVLVHFFVCKNPKKAAWLGLLKFHHDHQHKGLVILAVTRDSKGAVEQLLKDIPLPFPVGTNSDMPSSWQASGDYGQVILDPQGDVYHTTPASNGTWNGKLLKALKGSDRLGASACLRMVPTEPFGRGVKRVVESMGEGKLSKALAALDALLAGATTGDEDRAQAEILKDEIETHIETLLAQINTSISRGEVLPARDALEALAKELKRHPLGEPARERLAELEEDEAFADQVEAAELYDHLVDAFFRRGWKKNLARFEKLVKDFPETRAAEKMKNYWIKHAW